jgi:hypothetical protein
MHAADHHFWVTGVVEDRTMLFLDTLDLPRGPAPPRFEELRDLFNKELTGNGVRVQLPVAEPLFASLTCSDSSLRDVITTASHSGAWALSDCIGNALRMAPQFDATDEITIAGTF